MTVPTKRITATERFHSEARRKRAGPLVLLSAGAGIPFVAVVGFILFGGSGREETLKARFEELKGAGADLQMRDRLDDAAGKYREAIALVEGNEKFRSGVVDLKARLREIAGLREGLKEARARFEAYKARAEKRKPDDLNELRVDGSRLLSDVEKARVPWRDELTTLLAKIDAEIAAQKRAGDDRDFRVQKDRIGRKYRLGEEIPHDWGGVIREWRAYLKLDGVTAADLKKAEEEVGTSNARAKGEFRALGLKIQRLVDSGRKGEAIQALDKERPASSSPRRRTTSRNSVRS